MTASPPLVTRRLPLWLGLAAFLLYAFTAARTIQWQDSAQFTYRVGAGRVDNVYGLAMTHPLHFMLGRAAATLLPHRVPWALALVSALGGAVAVGGAAACVRELTRRAAPAVFTAATLTLAHTFWRFSGLPEVYTLSAALLTLQLWVYLRTVHRGRASGWPWVFALNGVAAANHNLALLTLGVWGIAFLLQTRHHPRLCKLVPAIAALWLIGALPYLLLILREALSTGDWGTTLHSALFGHGFRDQVLGMFPRPLFTLVTLAFLALSFPNLAFPLAAGTARRGKPNAFRLPMPFWGILGLQSLFFLRYDVIDQYTFLIPVFPLIAIAAGVGYANRDTRRVRRAAWTLLLLQPLLYAATPGLIRATGWLEPFARDKPFRDDATYLFHPWQAWERSALKLADAALQTAAPDGIIIVADPMAWHTLLWERKTRRLDDDITLLRPEEYDAMLDALVHKHRLVWAPLRSTDPPPEGWTLQNGVWVAD